MFIANLDRALPRIKWPSQSKWQSVFLQSIKDSWGRMWTWSTQSVQCLLPIYESNVHAVILLVCCRILESMKNGTRDRHRVGFSIQQWEYPPSKSSLTSFRALSPSCFKVFSIALLREIASLSSTLWPQPIRGKVLFRAQRWLHFTYN